VNDQPVAAVGSDVVQVLGTLTVVARAIDTVSTIGRVEILVDGEVRAKGDAMPFSWRWKTNQETTGDHQLEVRARDLAGNENTTQLTVAVLIP
jgi:hypothetical protein